MKQTIKDYYKEEVNSITPPTMPGFKKKQNKKIKPWENVVLAAITAAAMFLITLPGAYDSPIRDVAFNSKHREIASNEISRVIYSANIYYRNKRRITDE